jgi:hypothetical protein
MVEALPWFVDADLVDVDRVSRMRARLALAQSFAALRVLR